MTCKSFEERIARSIDGALADAERPVLERHLADCPACAAFRDDLARHDRELRAAFEGPRAQAAALAERTVATLRKEARPRRRASGWISAFAAAAAGFAIAWAVKPGAPALAPDQTPEPLKHPTGRIVLATGPLSLVPRGGAPQEAAVGDTFEMGTRLNCGEALAEIETSDGSRVWLNRETAVLFVANRNLELVKGELLSRAVASRLGLPYRVGTPDGTVTTAAATIVVSTGAGTRLRVLEGEARFEDWRKFTCPVGSPQWVASTGGVCDRQARPLADPVLETSWVHGALRPGSDEHRSRVLALVEGLEGRDARRHAIALRRMGEGAVSTLLQFLREHRGSKGARLEAATIAADLAGPRHVEELADFAREQDDEVCRVLRRALVRLTGSESPDEWRRFSER